MNNATKGQVAPFQTRTMFMTMKEEHDGGPKRLVLRLAATTFRRGATEFDV